MSRQHRPIQAKNKIEKNSNPGKSGFVVSEQKFELYKGSLPHPDMLEKYEAMYPGITKELLHLVKEQTLHRISIESKVVDSNIKNSKKGLSLGFMIAMTGLIGSIFCITQGFEIGGSILGGSGLLGLVSVFVYGSKQRDRELKEKKEKY